MSQPSFVDVLLPKGFGHNAKLEKIAGLLNWSPIEALVQKVRNGDHQSKHRSGTLQELLSRHEFIALPRVLMGYDRRR